MRSKNRARVSRWAAKCTPLAAGRRLREEERSKRHLKRLPPPQPGPQTEFYNSEADILVYGGSAGGGKTFGLLIDFGREEFTSNPGYGFVIFRRTSPEITNEHGLWDESALLYRDVGAIPRQGDHSWRWPSGAKGRFAHLQLESDKEKWQGGQIARIGFDELTHFTETQFFYMLSRNRSVCGIRPQVRATTNPKPGWVKKFLSPWLDKNFPNPAKSGELRWFVRVNGVITWVDEGYQLPREQLEGDLTGLDEAVIDDMRRAKSVTFIRSSVYDNKELLRKDPGYLTNLRSQSKVDQARLLHGDWDVFEGAFFDEWSDSAHTEVPRYRPPGKTGPLPILPRWWTFFGGMDWGYSDKSAFAFLLMAIDEHGTTHVIEEIWRQKLLDDDQAVAVVALLSKWGVPLTIPIACDPSMWSPTKSASGRYDGPKTIEAFWKAGLRGCAAADNDRIAGWSQVRRFLAIRGNESHFKAWKGYCEHLIDQFPLMEYSTTEPNDMDTDGDDHLHDCLRYALSTRPRPSAGDPHAPKPPKETNWDPAAMDKAERKSALL